MEFIPVFEEFAVSGRGEMEKTLLLKRWVDLPAQGWWPGDVHVHHPSSGPAQSEYLIQYALAEDMHVVNLLEMGRRSVAPAGRRPGLRPPTIVLPLSPSDRQRAGVRGRPSVEHPTDSSVKLRGAVERGLFLCEPARESTASAEAVHKPRLYGRTATRSPEVNHGRRRGRVNPRAVANSGSVKGLRHRSVRPWRCATGQKGKNCE
jgi:hypothetical protein